MDVKPYRSGPRSEESINRSLFWIQTLTTGSLVLISAIFILSNYLRNGAWQFIGLFLITLVVLCFHFLGWLIVLSGGSYRKAIWIIGYGHVFGSIFAPLFMENYWLIGPFLLLLVPLEVGIVDDPRKVPSAFVLSLLGMAGLLIVDLWGPFERIQFAREIEGAVELAGIILLIHLIVHLWVLWNYRLRPDSNHGLRLDLATQLTLVFTGLAGASILLVVAVLMVQFRRTQINEVGRNFQILAENNAERVGNTLNNQIDALLALGRQNAIIQDGLQKSNEQLDQQGEDAVDTLKRIDKTWRMLPDVNEFVLRFRSNAQAIELSKFRGVDLLHSNLILVDRLGGLVAAQGLRPERFYYGDQEWFIKAWNQGLGGIFIGHLEYLPSRVDSTVLIAVGVLNPQTNQISGVLASTYSLRGIRREIIDAQIRGDVETILLEEDGTVIAASNESIIGSTAWSEVIKTGFLPSLVAGENLNESGWLIGRDYLDHEAVLAYAPLNTSTSVKIEDLRSLNWLTVISETQTQALAGVIRSIKITTLVGILLMIVIVAVATWLARLLSRPIEALRVAAVAASEGDLDQRAELVGPVELVSLAEAFNALASHLRSLINNLQDQVAERTHQLQVRADELTTLNRITAAVASTRDLDAALGVVSREMVYLFNVKHTAIALMDKQRNSLTINAEYNRIRDSKTTLGMNFPIEESPVSRKVIETNRTLTVYQAQMTLENDPIYELLLRTDTHSLMIVPLQAGGEVIGTIDITCSDDDRVYISAEIELAETIAGQIAGAIDNARLFSEMEAAKESAEAANIAKSDFLANVSHELRTPLTSVMGFARIVQKRLHERILPHIETDDERTLRAIEQVDENLKIIISEGVRLTSLINNVLDLSKIESGKVDWHVQSIQIAEVINHAVAATSSLLVPPENELKFIIDIRENLPEVMGDRDQLVQVMINLISNAIKFTRRGTITCRAELLEEEILVSVKDTGMGIAPEDQQRVFEKFIQLGDTLTEKPSGTGLGLPITKKIIESHGGRIWLESKPGKGSTFFFTIPVHSDRIHQNTEKTLERSQ